MFKKTFASVNFILTILSIALLHNTTSHLVEHTHTLTDVKLIHIYICISSDCGFIANVANFSLPCCLLLYCQCDNAQSHQQLFALAKNS